MNLAPLRVAVALSLFSCVSCAPVLAQDFVGATYPDVPRGHWAFNALDRVTQAGLIEGLPDGTFGGNRAMTRYEFAAVMARVLDRLGAKDVPSEGAEFFGDVPREHWAFWATGRVSRHGIVEGMPGDRFSGDAVTTRYSSAVAFARLMSRMWDARFNSSIPDPLGRPPREPEPEPEPMMIAGAMFADVPQGHWAYAAIGRMIEAGHFEGEPDDRFQGARPLTRYAFVSVMARMIDRVGAGN